MGVISTGVAPRTLPKKTLMAKDEKIDADRMKRWEALVENFKKERPLAYEARKNTGEFDKPPVDFL